MAETAGIVQRLHVSPGGSFACIWIGPTPTNTELLFVEHRSGEPAWTATFQSSMVDALASAVVTRREVVAIHGATSARITALRIDPA
jgi:hypothetical protein